MEYTTTTETNVFSGAYDPIPRETVSLAQALDAIRNGQYAADITRLRALLAAGDIVTYTAQKNTLDAFTPCGTFAPRRSIANLIKHSGVVHGDLDHLPDVAAIQENLRDDPWVLYCFISPSGAGLKLGVRVEPVSDDAAYKHAWQIVADAYQRTYGIPWDRSGKDISRLCFVSHDPGIYINPDARVFVVAPYQAPSPHTSSVVVSVDQPLASDRRELYAQQALQTAVNMIDASTPPTQSASGTRHASRLKASRLLGGYVAGGILDYDTAYQALTDAVARNTDNFVRSIKTIVDGLRHGEQQAITFDQLEAEREDWLRQHSARLVVPTASVNGSQPYVWGSPDQDSNADSVLFWEFSTPWPELSLEALHGLAGRFVETLAAHTEADPVGILVQVLVMFGNMVGRAPYAVVEADRHYLNVFAALVGDTAKGRKGVSQGHARRIIEGVDKLWTQTRITSGLASGEGLIWHVRDATYKTAKDGTQECIDAGEQDKRLLVFEPELARVLGVLTREGNTLSAVIRHAWDDGTLHTLVSGRRIAAVHASNAHISIIGHITTDELRRTLTATETSNGFANRFLWACVRRAQLLPEGGRYPQQELAPLLLELDAAVIAARKTGRMQRDDAACERWAEIYEGLSEGKPGLLGHVTARAEAQVLRLSCVYALLDKSTVVQEPHLNAALALWQYCEASAAYIFGDALGDSVADEILRALRAVAPTSMTRTEISNLFDRNKPSAAIQRALAALLRQQLVTVKKEATKGRPVEHWSARLISIPLRKKN